MKKNIVFFIALYVSAFLFSSLFFSSFFAQDSSCSVDINDPSTIDGDLSDTCLQNVVTQIQNNNTLTSQQLLDIAERVSNGTFYILFTPVRDSSATAILEVVAKHPEADDAVFESVVERLNEDTVGDAIEESRERSETILTTIIDSNQVSEDTLVTISEYIVDDGNGVSSNYISTVFENGVINSAREGGDKYGSLVGRLYITIPPETYVSIFNRVNTLDKEEKRVVLGSLISFIHIDNNLNANTVETLFPLLKDITQHPSISFEELLEIQTLVSSENPASILDFLCGIGNSCGEKDVKIREIYSAILNRADIQEKISGGDLKIVETILRNIFEDPVVSQHRDIIRSLAENLNTPDDVIATLLEGKSYQFVWDALPAERRSALSNFSPPMCGVSKNQCISGETRNISTEPNEAAYHWDCVSEQGKHKRCSINNRNVPEDPRRGSGDVSDDPGGSAIILVPVECRGSNAFVECDIPALAKLAGNIASFFVTLAIILFVFVLIRIGFGIIQSGEAVQGRLHELGRGRKAVIGIIIALLAFPIVYFIFQTLQFRFNNGDPFYVDENLSLPNAKNITVNVPDLIPLPVRMSATGYSGTRATEREAGDRISNAYGNTNFKNLINNYDETFAALLIQESGGCQSKVGPEVIVGGKNVRAYGCSQMLVSTARSIAGDRFAGLSDQQIADMLVMNDALSIDLGNKYFQSLLDKNDGDEALALAEYNGGAEANGNSVNCPGARKWECPFYKGGAEFKEEADGEETFYENGKFKKGIWVCNTSTECGRYTRAQWTTYYIQTRNYVHNILAMKEQLER